MQNGKVTIELDRLRHLCFDWNAVCEFEEVTQRSIFDQELWEGLEKKPVGKIVRAMLWAALLEEDPSLTLKDAGKLLGFSNLPQVYVKLSEAFQSANAKDDKKADPPSDSLGVNSGPLPDTTSG